MPESPRKKTVDLFSDEDENFPSSKSKRGVLTHRFSSPIGANCTAQSQQQRDSLFSDSNSEDAGESSSKSKSFSGVLLSRKGLFEHDDEYDRLEVISATMKRKMKTISREKQQIQQFATKLQQQLQDANRRVIELTEQVADKDKEKLLLFSQIRDLDEKVERRNKRIQKMIVRFQQFELHMQEKEENQKIHGDAAVAELNNEIAELKLKLKQSLLDNELLEKENYVLKGRMQQSNSLSSASRSDSDSESSNSSKYTSDNDLGSENDAEKTTIDVDVEIHRDVNIVIPKEVEINRENNESTSATPVDTQLNDASNRKRSVSDNSRGQYKMNKKNEGLFSPTNILGKISMKFKKNSPYKSITSPSGSVGNSFSNQPNSSEIKSDNEKCLSKDSKIKDSLKPASADRTKNNHYFFGLSAFPVTSKNENYLKKRSVSFNENESEENESSDSIFGSSSDEENEIKNNDSSNRKSCPSIFVHTENEPRHEDFLDKESSKEHPLNSSSTSTSDHSSEEVKITNQGLDGSICSDINLDALTTEKTTSEVNSDTVHSKENLFDVDIVDNSSDSEKEQRRKKKKKKKKSSKHASIIIDEQEDSEVDEGDNLMNDYMRRRAMKRREKLRAQMEKEICNENKQNNYEKEWAKLAEEEKKRKKIVLQQRTKKHKLKNKSNSKKNAASETGGSARVSLQRRRQKHKQAIFENKSNSSSNAPNYEKDSNPPPPPPPPQSISPIPPAAKEGFENDNPPLPPQPSEAEMELYQRQQTRLRELFETEKRKRIENEEAIALKGQIHERMTVWKRGKKVLQMLQTLHEFSENNNKFAIQFSKVEALVANKFDNDTEVVKKAYRSLIRLIHPDKLRDVSVAERLEAQELFSVVTTAFEQYKLVYNI